MENVMNFIKTNRYFPWGVAFVAGVIFGSYGSDFTSVDTASDGVVIVEKAPVNTVHANIEEPLEPAKADENSDTLAETPTLE